MKPSLLLTVLAIGCTASLSHTHGSTVLSPDPTPGGIDYTWTVNLGASDSAFVSGHVGPWSWQDEDLGSNTGWAHESNWIAVSLAAPAQLTLVLSSKGDVPDPGQAGGLAGNNLFPGITMWAGWDNDGTMSHAYFNKGNNAWAEDISYLTHIPGGSGHSIQGTWTLPAGQYTFAFGGDSTSLVFEERQGYGATFTTAAPVPEPTTAVLLSLASLPLLFRRKR